VPRSGAHLHSATAATPYCSLTLPPAALANVPKLSHTSIFGFVKTGKRILDSVLFRGGEWRQERRFCGANGAHLAGQGVLAETQSVSGADISKLDLSIMGIAF